MSIKAIFYDFDGVIKDSTDIKSQAFYELYLPFGVDIAKKVMQHHLAHGGMSRFEKFKLYHHQFLNTELSKEEVDEWATKFSELVLQKVITSPYVPGAYEAIIEGSKHYLQFIVTGTPQKEIEFIIDKLGIIQHFKKIGGSPAKKIEISSYFLSEYNLSPDNVLFVGDATTDYECSKYFGFKFYLREHSENKILFKNINVFKSGDLNALMDYAKQF